MKIFDVVVFAFIVTILVCVVVNKNDQKLYDTVAQTVAAPDRKNEIVRTAILEALRAGVGFVRFEYDRSIVEYLKKEGFPDDTIIVQSRTIIVILDRDKND